MAQAVRTYRIELKSLMPLLPHNDSIDWADEMEAWKNNAENKRKSKAGDDRTPAFRWIGCLYHAKINQGEDVITIPCENIMACLGSAGSMVPTGKGKSTFKSLSQSGMFIPEYHWPLQTGGRTISYSKIQPLREISEFIEHIRAVEKLGFSLFMKRAGVNNTKHIRVRPRFEEWSCEGDIEVTDDQITIQILQELLRCAGKYKGLCDWRPGSPKRPGPFGTFTATVTES